MNNLSKKDIARSLTELSDEEAIAIMEGRVAAVEKEETKEAARTLAVDVLETSVDSPRLEQDELIGGNVVQLITRQPWMRMAAAMVAGIAIASAVNAPLQMADSGTFGLVSANVTYLEVLRSSDPGDVPLVEVTPAESWLTLIAYPNFADAERMRIRVERAADAANEDIRWQPVLEEITGVGSRDSLVVNVPMESVENGLHRLRIDSESQGSTVESTIMRFRVKTRGE